MNYFSWSICFENWYGKSYFKDISNNKHVTLESKIAHFTKKLNNKSWKTLWMCIWHRRAVNRGLAIYTNPTEAVKFPLKSTVKHCWAQTFSCNPPMTLISSVALPFLQLPKPSPRGCSALGLKNGPRRRGLRYFQTLRQILLCVLLNDFLWQKRHWGVDQEGISPSYESSRKIEWEGDGGRGEIKRKEPQ